MHVANKREDQKKSRKTHQYSYERVFEYLIPKPTMIFIIF